MPTNTDNPTAFVLCVRDPDSSNEFTVDGPVCVIDIDLGSSFDGRPGDEETAGNFAESVTQLDPVPVSSPVFTAAVDVYIFTVENYPTALAIVTDYVAARLQGTETTGK